MRAAVFALLLATPAAATGPDPNGGDGPPPQGAVGGFGAAVVEATADDTGDLAYKAVLKKHHGLTAEQREQIRQATGGMTAEEGGFFARRFKNHPGDPPQPDIDLTRKMQNFQKDTNNPGGGGGDQPASQVNPFNWGGSASPAAAPELQYSRPYMEALRAQEPSNPYLNFSFGVQDQARGDHRAALGSFETAISGGQDDARTLTFASLSALNAGDPRKAALWASQALEKDPSGAMAEQAEAISRMALKRLPKEEDPFKNRPVRRSDASDGARPGESVPELERPLPPKTADPGLPAEVKALLAETNRLVAQASKAYRTGDIKEAVKLAGEALAKDPDDVRALQVRAAAQAKAGHWEEARQDAERGLDLAPGYVPLLLLRAAAAVHAKDWKAVKADAEAVLSKERTNPTAWRFQGLAQAALGDRAAASASLGRAAQYGDPEAPRLLAAARSLPPGADVVDLVELLAGSAAEREASSSAPAAPPAAEPSRRGRIGLVVGAAVLAGVVAGGLILLLGRRDSESA